MEKEKIYDVLIIGGSYAGLSAALSLGRALRSVLVIDSGSPCNRQTPHSHNFLTQDGIPPAIIGALGREQVEQYPGIHFHEGTAISGHREENGFTVTTASGSTFTAQKLLFATGIRDIIPSIPGFAECWGISVIHCPYCHGYEVRHQPTGLIGNDTRTFEFAQFLLNWTNDLTLFTNGKSALSETQHRHLQEKGIQVVREPIAELQHENGRLQYVRLAQKQIALKAVYARIPFGQHCTVPQQLGCRLTDEGYIHTDDMRQTSIPHIYAAGDCTTPMRSVANAVAAGSAAGAFINHAWVAENM